MSVHNEMTRYAFISHIEDYLKQLLKDPLRADTDEFLKYHGFDGPKTLSILLMPSDPKDENTAIVLRKLSIKDNGYNEKGERLKDTFSIKYRIPRKDYTKKMRNLYINLFESNIIENSLLNEGAWGYGILDNDSALDKQTEFGKSSLILLQTRMMNANDDNEKWANLGVLVDFIKKYDHNELHFTDEYNKAIELCKTVAMNLLESETFITSWNNESKIKSELKRIYKDMSSIAYDKDRLNEDGEGGGATSADASGQFTTPLFGGPIKRKTMYITQEQETYIKKMIEEESVMNTQAGDFGYDVPFGDDSDFYKEAKNHKNIMKNSWQNE
jgi:hypothetical protein